MAKLYFYYGSMNAGKSAFLLASANNYKERGMGTLILKPEVDTRDQNGEVSSRMGVSAPATLITQDMDVYEFFKWKNSKNDIHCVYVDEAQFLSQDNIFQLCKIADLYDVPVMCYGLRTDFRGNLFEGSKFLLGAADKMEELKGICHCGKKATMVARINENGDAVLTGEQIEVGGNDRYVSLCRKHWCETVGIYS